MDYTVKKNQYNFKKHVYKESDLSTDFIVLKINPPNNIHNPIFNSDSIPINDKYFYCLKAIHINGGLQAEMENPEFLFYDKRNAVNLIDFMGTAGEGSSGAPLFNSKGQVLGIVESGWDTFQFNLIRGENRGKYRLMYI